MTTKFAYSEFLIVFTLFCDSSTTLYKGDKCSLSDGSYGMCKLITECSTAQEMLQAGVNPTICGFEKYDSIVCCMDGIVSKVNATATTEIIDRTPNITVTTEGRIPGHISKQKCKEYAQYAYEEIESPTLLLKPHVSKIFECDLQKDKLVVGGSVASRREFPHMALIGYKDEDDIIIWYCGGSLISENFVLTAAQCFYLQHPYEKKSAELVRLGLTNKTHLNDYMQERTVSGIIPYPEYNKSKYHDIGLLQLAEKVDFNTYVRPACLQTEKNVPHDKAIATGWGAIDLLEENSDILLKVVMELVSADVCNFTYRDSISNGVLKNGIVDDLMICAGVTTNIRGTCEGDGGGPLQVYHKETEDVKCMYDIIGIISFGNLCGLSDNIDVHTRVSTYINWIEDIVWAN